MQRFTFLLTVVVAAVFSTASSAEEKPSDRPSDRPAAPALFKKLDQNGDGKLVADEIPAARRFYYERLVKTSDANGDGVITEEEFSAGFAKRGRGNRSDQQVAERQRQRARARENARNRPEGARGAQLFKRLDKNGDGKITREEMPQAQQARFDRMLKSGDQDGDGALSRNELGRVVAGGASEQSPEARRRMAARRAGGQPGKLFALLDADRDGKLSRAELKRAPRLVSQLDTDGDQALSARELMAAVPRSGATEGKAKAKKSQKKGEQKKKKKAGQNREGKKKKEEKKASEGEAKLKKL